MLARAFVTLCVLTLLAPLSASAQPTTAPTPIAWYKFNGDPTDNGVIRDEAGKGASADLKRAPVTDTALVCNGIYENAGNDGGYRAVFAVPALDYKSLTVAWRFKAKSFDSAGGRHREHLLAGGTSYRWLLFSREAKTGKLMLIFNNGDDKYPIDDTQIEVDKWTTVACSLDLNKRRVIVALNGRIVKKLELPKDFTLRVLGTNAEPGDRQIAFSNYSNGQTFDGEVDEFIVFDKAMEELFLARLLPVANAPKSP